jgi:hypothetical protein
VILGVDHIAVAGTSHACDCVGIVMSLRDPQTTNDQTKLPLVARSVGFRDLAVFDGGDGHLDADMASLGARHNVSSAVHLVSHVNGKDLRIGLLRVLSRELIELIEVKRPT